VNTVMNLRDSIKKAGYFLTSWVTISFSNNVLHHGVSNVYLDGSIFSWIYAAVIKHQVPEYGPIWCCPPPILTPHQLITFTWGKVYEGISKSFRTES
jgi:hypothetical protein